MYTYTRLNQVYNSSETILFDDNSKFVFFSDCHRGDGSKADNFIKNRDIYLYSLKHYYEKDFTYIELGDGDELWENDHFSDLFKTHVEVYLLLQKFYTNKRLYMIWGNHDVFKSSRSYVKNTLNRFYDYTAKCYKALYRGIEINEGLILHYKNTPYRIFVIHGHQGDILDDVFWPFSRFLVRHFWRLFEILKYNKCINTTKRKERMIAVQSNIKRWSKNNKKMIIAGHTHKSAFPAPGQIPYFNDGCCINKGYITCIEIQDGCIMLVKWARHMGSNRVASIRREVMAGPKKIEDYFRDNNLFEKK